MSITIKWSNPNTTFDEVQVFRSDTKLAAGEIPTNKIATITDSGILEYEDTTALQNKYYWYVIAVKKGTEVVYAPQSVAINMPYTGPGPSTLQSGTWERGFFGMMQAADLVLTQEIQALTGGTVNATQGEWGKFILKGKILFAPLRHVVSISWNTLYSAGCMYGVAGNGPATGHGLTGVDQLKILSKGEHDFIIRTPRCQTSADYVYNAGVPKDYDSEWFHCFVSMFNQNNPFPSSDVASYDPAIYFLQASSYNTVFAEFNGANAASQYAASNPGQVMPPGSGTPRTTNFMQRLILELVL